MYQIESMLVTMELEKLGHVFQMVARRSTVSLFAGSSNRTRNHLFIVCSENVKLSDGFCPFAASDKKIVHLSSLSKLG